MAPLRGPPDLALATAAGLVEGWHPRDLARLSCVCRDWREAIPPVEVAVRALSWKGDPPPQQHYYYHVREPTMAEKGMKALCMLPIDVVAPNALFILERFEELTLSGATTYGNRHTSGAKDAYDALVRLSDRLKPIVFAVLVRLDSATASVRVMAFGLLAKMASVLEAADVAAIAVNLSVAPNRLEKDRALACTTIASIGAPLALPHVPKIAETCDDDSPAVRVAAIRALSELGPEVAAPYALRLKGLLKDAAPTVRTQALLSIRNLKLERFVPDLTALVVVSEDKTYANEASTFVSLAVTCLTSIASKETVAPHCASIATFVMSPRPPEHYYWYHNWKAFGDIRNACLYVLRWLGPLAAPHAGALYSLATRKDESTKAMIVGAEDEASTVAYNILVDLGAAAAPHVGVAVERLEHTNPDARIRVLECLALLGSAAKPHQAVIIARLSDGRATVRAAACAALAAIAPDDSVAVASVAAVLSDHAKQGKLAALNALATIGMMAAPHAQLVAKNLDSDIVDIRVATINALTAFGEFGRPWKKKMKKMAEEKKANARVKAAAKAALASLLVLDGVEAITVASAGDNIAGMVAALAATEAKAIKSVKSETVGGGFVVEFANSSQVAASAADVRRAAPMALLDWYIENTVSDAGGGAQAAQIHLKTPPGTGETDGAEGAPAGEAVVPVQHGGTGQAMDVDHGNTPAEV